MAAPGLQQDLTASLIRDINTAGNAAARNEIGAREKLLNLAYSLAASVELPSEAISRMGWAEPARFALCRTAVNLKLFEELAKSKASSISADDLAIQCKSHPVLMARLLKHLAAMNIVKETAEDHYAPTPLSTAFTEPQYRDGLIYTFDVAGPSYRSMPEYLKSVSYNHPTDGNDGPFQYAHNIQEPFFAYLAQNLAYFSCFNNYMMGYRQGKPSWIDPGFYPFQERIVPYHSSDSSALLVDVGGGMGQDLKELLSKVPGLDGRLILQDKEDVIAQVASSHGFEAIAHDFFTEQPVKEATAYYLHSVLHDWSDDDCRRILKPLVTAMKRGYSKLLVNELVIPSTEAAWPATSMDWLMMALGAVKERTESEWRVLLESAGLKVTGIWTIAQGTESLIETEVA